MVFNAGASAIGLTGPFGSGCSEAATILESKKGYVPVSLSEVIKREWKGIHPRKLFTRADLQALGNQLRERAKNPGYVATTAMKEIQDSDTEHEYLVFDGIRNLGEVEALKDRFGRRFYLFAIECSRSERWERKDPKEYSPRGLKVADFTADDERDRDEEHRYGQQIELCVDRADVLITNDDEVTLAAYRRKLVQYEEVVTGQKPRFANPQEILMNMAYSGSHGSKCLKRQVGAIVVAAPAGKMGEVVGQGFNENPVGTAPCVEEPRYGADAAKGVAGRCFRDIVRQASISKLVVDGKRCPACGARLTGPISEKPPWRCARPKCNTKLEKWFWPERAISHCTAVHAEVAALMAAGERARGATLYTTTFPCFQCAEKIVHAGVRCIVYNEPYPDVRAAERLEIGAIDVAKFEGIRSGRFDDIFSRARPYVEDQLRILREEKT